jgi:curved DNA-binding protein CbpA
MPSEFRGDPYRVLDVPSDASDEEIKRRWRELARDHHPDRAAGDSKEAGDLTRRMARINAAYDLLRDPERRARFDASPGGHAAAARSRRHHGRGNGNGFRAPADGQRPSGPPPPRPTPPVTARFDASELFHRRNATTSHGRPSYAAQRPVSARERHGDREPLRASQPTGPIERHTGRHRQPPPTLEEARATTLEFGKFRGHTLGEVATVEPTYIDWIARTITRDRDLVVRARIVQADLDARGVEREFRPPTPGFGNGRTADPV